MPLIPCNIIRVQDITAKARNIVLKSGLGTVLWDTCHLVWDSCDLLEDAPAKQDQVAVFGARGQIQSLSEKRHAFLIRYIVDFETGPQYRLRVVLTGPLGGKDETIRHQEVDIAPIDVAEGGDREFFCDAIYALTRKLGSVGVEGAIRFLLTDA